MDRQSLKQRRDEAIRTGKVFLSKFNEATNWTYKDFRDATQILVNRLVQLLKETDTDKPGEQEAKLLADVSNMAKVWSDKVTKVFYQDKPVDKINPSMSNEKPISKEFIQAIDRALYDVGYTNLQSTIAKDGQQVKFTFKGNSEHGWNLEVLLDIFKFKGKIVCGLSCYALDNKDLKQTLKKDSNTVFEITSEDPQEVLELVQNLFLLFERDHGEPERVLVAANNSLNIQYRMPIDKEVLAIVED